MKNDVAFLLDNYRLNMFEQQSSINPNMPLRNLFYVSRELEMLIDRKTLYGRKLVKIPTPKFVVFYNGTEEQPERLELRLSDSFNIKTDEIQLELKVLQLNINQNCNKSLMGQCKTLKEYAIYVQRVRDYAEKMDIESAVERAVTECIKDGVLKEFLDKHRREAVAVSIFEYDEEKELKLLREAEREMGYEQGLEQGREEASVENAKRLFENGASFELVAASITDVPREILEKIYKEKKG